MNLLALLVFIFTCPCVTGKDASTCAAPDVRFLSEKLVTTGNSVNDTIKKYKTTTFGEITQIKDILDQQTDTFNTLELKDVELKKIQEEITLNMTVFGDFVMKADGGWSSWSNWTECTATCLGGLTRRSRTCTNPEPSTFGRACVGKYEEVERCNAILCPDTDDCTEGLCKNGATCLDGLYTYTCTCAVGFTGKNCDIGCNISSCKDAPKVSSTYQIYPTCEVMTVYCDQATDGGGWIVIQRRKSGSVDFNRTWVDYRSGFGDLEGEFWLGNDNIHALTAAGFNELRIDMKDTNGIVYHAKYSNFSVSAEKYNYRLQVGEYSGNASDYLSYHNRAGFATKDWDVRNFAEDNGGGWWYNDYYRYYYVNLNGDYLQYFYWHIGLSYSEMKIRQP